MTLHSDLVDWLVKAFGVVRVEDAASYAELDNDLTEYQVVDGSGEAWAWTDNNLGEALHYLAQEPDGHIEYRTVSPWVRLEREGASDA